MTIGLLLDLQGKLLAREARRLGFCPDRSAQGFCCTLKPPHDTHEAWLDGKLLFRWMGPGLTGVKPNQEQDG